MRNLLLLSAFIPLAACDLSPEFKLPDMQLPEVFKEQATVQAVDAAVIDDVKWKRVDAKEKIEETAWWRMFNLPELDALEEQAMKDSPTLEVALARLQSAQGVAEVSGSALLPSAEIGAGPARQQSSKSIVNANSPAGFSITPKPFNSYTTQGSISYMLDLFGKNRNTAKAAQQDADAEANRYYAARLALQAELADTYIRRAALLAEDKILARSMVTRTITRNHVLTKNKMGLTDDLVLASAEGELANAEAVRQGVAQQLAVVEHQIAMLVGTTPAQLTLGTTRLTALPPVVPAGVPSTLLARRPDIAAAVSDIAAANAHIGAAKAGYFPDISLSLSGGFAATELSDMFKKSSQFWALGPMAGGTILTQPLFEGGKIDGTLRARNATYDAASATYRATALTAFKEVEDSLSNLRTLGDQAKAVGTAYNAAKRGLAVADQRYKVGYSSQLDYLDVERSALAAERANVQVLGERYVATVQLVKALGGGWRAAPKADNNSIRGQVVEKKLEAPASAEVVDKKEAPADSKKPWWDIL